jgi:hypothetical protein
VVGSIWGSRVDRVVAEPVKAAPGVTGMRAPVVAVEILVRRLMEEAVPEGRVTGALRRFAPPGSAR